MKPTLAAIFLVMLLGCPTALLAEHQPPATAAPLPDPLTLDAALSAASDHHPTVDSARAAASALEAGREKALADDDARLDLSLQMHRVDPAAGSPYDDHDDSRGTLTLYKRLYDFGRTRHRIKAAEQALEAGDIDTRLARLQLRRQIMQDFFDVILADLAAATANEAMSVAYIRLDRGKDQYELKRISDVELLRLEDAYQTALLARQRAELQQRQSRNRLALTLDRPGELSSSLEAPQLPGLLETMADHDQLLKAALDNSPELRRIKAQLATVEEERSAIRAQRYPELYLQLEANEYRQEFGSRSPYRAILGLDIPLYQGNRVDADLAAVEARRQSLRAETRQTEYRIRQALLETLQQIDTLRMQLKQAEIREDFRERYLDRSRSQYELEINTDLGDAMVEQSAARAFATKTRFDLALARETLVILTGDPTLSALNTPPSNNPTGEATP